MFDDQQGNEGATPLFSKSAFTQLSLAEGLSPAEVKGSDESSFDSLIQQRDETLKSDRGEQSDNFGSALEEYSLSEVEPSRHRLETEPRGFCLKRTGSKIVDQKIAHSKRNSCE